MVVLLALRAAAPAWVRAQTGRNLGWFGGARLCRRPAAAFSPCCGWRCAHSRAPGIANEDTAETWQFPFYLPGRGAGGCGGERPCLPDRFCHRSVRICHQQREGVQSIITLGGMVMSLSSWAFVKLPSEPQ